MPEPAIVVTGALSFTGKYATRLLLQSGYRVRSLTYHMHRENPFGEQVELFPYNFDEPEKLRANLRGAFALINTYWVRFSHGSTTFEAAVRNTRILIEAARDAGVERIVHVSIANPSLDSPLGYYRGKAQVEQAVRESGLPHAILRPAVLFGRDGILINNIAWFLRHFPVFGVPGDGRYRIQPIFVGDMAELAVAALKGKENDVRDAVGPEVFTFEGLVEKIGKAIGRPARIVHLPRPVAYAATQVTGWFLSDIVLTWEEYRGLMADLLVSDGPATGKTRLSEWLSGNGEQLGVRYDSELARHFRQELAEPRPEGRHRRETAER